MKKLKAILLRDWHCLKYTLIIPFTSKYGIDHRAITEKGRGKITYLGCQCGKEFFGKPFFTDEMIERLRKEVFEKKSAS